MLRSLIQDLLIEQQVQLPTKEVSQCFELCKHCHCYLNTDVLIRWHEPTSDEAMKEVGCWRWCWFFLTTLLRKIYIRPNHKIWARFMNISQNEHISSPTLLIVCWVKRARLIYQLTDLRWAILLQFRWSAVSWIIGADQHVKTSRGLLFVITGNGSRH